MFKGTCRLVRLALRRDRIKLTAWVVGLAMLNSVTVPLLYESYGQPVQRIMYAQSMSTSMVGRVFGGLMDDASFGSIMMIEMFLFMTTLMAFMSVQVVIRHTRFNEEMGSTELMQSGLVGRFASLSAALVVAVLANAIIAVATGVVSPLFGYFGAESAWLMSLAMFGVGVSFAAIAAVIVQLSESARTCNILAGLVIGVGFLLRALGDGLAPYANVGEKVNSQWLAWLSPFGWGQQSYPFNRQHWWTLGLFVVFSLACVTVAFLILRSRDLGAGLLQQRAGRARASKRLLSPIGLAWRLHRNTVFVWVAIVACLGPVYGALGEQFKDVLGESDFWRQFVGTTGYQTNFTDAYSATMTAFMMMCCLVPFAIQILQRLRSEESNNFMEPVLGTAVSRTRWLSTHLIVAAAGIVLIALVFGASYGVSLKIMSGTDWSAAWRLVVAVMTYLPATAVYIGLIVVIFGTMPILTASIAWSVFIITLVISQLGVMLKFPQWLMDVSPFSHISNYPLEEINTLPLVILSVISFGLLALGYLTFKNRNLAR